MVKAPATPDFLLPFHFRNLGIRGRLVRLGTVAETVIAIHDYPDPVGELVAEALALSAALAGALKFDGVFTLQTKGDGPVSMIVADTTSAGDMRGYAGFGADRLARVLAETGPEIPPVPRLLGSGYLAFTVDQGPDTERYQGIVELVGATLSDCADQYMRQSEQIPTRIHLAAKRMPGANGPVWRAGALALQRLPSPQADSGPGQTGALSDWERALGLMANLADDDLLGDAVGPYHLLGGLFHDEPVSVVDARPLRHRCRCSELRVQRTLASIPAAELDGMKVDGQIEVVCQFCKATYSYDDAALRRFRAAG